MEFLTPDRVNEVADKMLRKGGIYRYLHPTAVPYIVEILTPHVRVIDRAQSRGDLIDWIDSYSPVGELNVRTAIQDISNDNVLKMKSRVVKMLIKFVVMAGEILALRHGSLLIVPWDIAAKLKSFDKRLARGLFPEVTDYLKVIFLVEDGAFRHEVTEEFVAGLIDGYLAAEGHVPLIFFDNQELTFDYTWTYRDPRHSGPLFTPVKIRRHEWIRGKYQAFYKTSTKLPDRMRGFNTPDYLQGARTATQWMGVDIHSFMVSVTDKARNKQTF